MSQESSHKAASLPIQNGAVLVSTQLLGDEGGSWMGLSLDAQRYLLYSSNAQPTPDANGGFATLSIATFYKTLMGLIAGRWSGTVVIDTGYGVKRLYLTAGCLTFGASNLIDDRLGEVMYREAQITLDQLTESAAQVTKQRKFGQVLLANGTMNQVQLWHALQLQVQQIVKSVFMVERVSVAFQEGSMTPATELVFPEDTGELVEQAAAYGVAYRSFLGQLTENSTAKLRIEPEGRKGPLTTGTFLGDMIDLIVRDTAVQKLLEKSKLMDLYTIAVIFQLASSGIIEVTPLHDEVGLRSSGDREVRSALDAYDYVLQAVRKAFSEANQPFPIDMLRLFVASMRMSEWTPIALDQAGAFSKQTVQALMSQVRDQESRSRRITALIEGMIYFLLQVAGDSIQFSVASTIRHEYRSIAS